jgi:hypothetical protein
MNKNLPSKKLQLMKKILPVVALAGFMVACNNPRPDAAKVESAQNTIILDTAGLAQYQAWKAQNEMAQYQQFGEQNNNNAATAPTRRYASSSSSNRTTTTRRSSSSGSGSTASTGTTATQKKGWSKAAKGAVIGGVAGGAAGAIINKRNRVVGGVVGGIIGAGVGYGVGRSQDKKDGRY